MKIDNLRAAIGMLRELLAELDLEECPGDWDFRRQLARSIVRIHRYEFHHRNAQKRYGSRRVCSAAMKDLGPKEVELYTEMEGLHLAIHRKLKAIRELR